MHIIEFAAAEREVTLSVNECTITEHGRAAGLAAGERGGGRERGRGKGETARMRAGTGVMSNRGGLGIAGAASARDYPRQRARRNAGCVLKREYGITLELSIYSAVGRSRARAHAMFSARRTLFDVKRAVNMKAAARKRLRESTSLSPDGPERRRRR